MTHAAYPLHWPVGWRRLTASQPARFHRNGRPVSIADAVQRVRLELDRFNAVDV